MALYFWLGVGLLVLVFMVWGRVKRRRQAQMLDDAVTTGVVLGAMHAGWHGEHLQDLGGHGGDFGGDAAGGFGGGDLGGM